MTIKHLRKMIDWSLVQCPQELVDTVLAQAADPDGIKQLDVAQVLFVTKHLQIRGFFSSAFVLWTRWVVSRFDTFEIILSLKYPFPEISSYAAFKANTTHSTLRVRSLTTRHTIKCAWPCARDGRARVAPSPK